MVMLEVDAVGLARGGRTLVDGVNLTLAAGEVLVLVGPNGAGKSTLLKMLAGEWQPDSGVIRVQGRCLKEWDATALARERAVLPQTSPLSFPFPVREVVAFGRNPHATGLQQDSRIVESLLQACDIAHLADAPYTRLSGGEKQRVHWARVLAQLDGARTPLLLMDEPTSALDLFHQLSLMQLLRARAGQGLAAVVALHDLNLAARFADRMLMLKAGRAEAVGTPVEVLTAENIQRVFGVAATLLPHPAGEYPLVVV